jgi:hypothetical protein
MYNHALTSAWMMWGKLNNPDYALQRDPEIWIKCAVLRIHRGARGGPDIRGWEGAEVVGSRSPPRR